MAVKYPPPFLARNQWKAKHPQGVYQKYVNAYFKRNPQTPTGYETGAYPDWSDPRVPGPRPLAARKPPAKGGGAGSQNSIWALLRTQTPGAIEAQANRMAQAQLDAQRKFLLAQTAQEKEDALRQMQAVAAAGRAAAAQNAGLFGAVGGEYNAGAQEIRNLGTGLAGSVAGATDAEVTAQNASLGNIGAPGLTVGGPAGAPGIAGDAQAGVAAYQQGELPGQAIANAGSAAQFGLAGLVSSQNLRATQEGIATYNDAINSLNKSQREELGRLVATRPDLVSGIVSKLTEANQWRMEMRMKIQAQLADAQSAQDALNYKYAQLRAQTQTNAQKLALDKWYKQQSSAISKYRASIYAQNAATSAYSAQTGRINAKTGQQRAATSAAAQAAKGVGPGKGRTWMATIANQTALLPTRLKGTDAAFNWVWSRIVNKIPKAQRAEARKWLQKQLKQIAAQSSSGAAPGGSLGTGTPN